MTTQTETTTDSEAVSALIEQLSAASKQAIEAGDAAKISKDDIAETLYIAARMFSAKTDREGKLEWPVGTDALNATETLVLVTALLEAADINLFDMAIWYRRP